jgi:hypothetical protein
VSSSSHIFGIGHVAGDDDEDNGWRIERDALRMEWRDDLMLMNKE